MTSRYVHTERGKQPSTSEEHHDQAMRLLASADGQDALVSAVAAAVHEIASLKAFLMEEEKSAEERTADLKMQLSDLTARALGDVRANSPLPQSRPHSVDFPTE